MPTLYSRVTSEPSVEPVTTTEAKAHLRIDHAEDDSLIAILIQAARELVEQHTNRSLITQTRTMKLEYFPRNGKIVLPNGPVSSVTSLTYYDESEVSQTLSASDYWTNLTDGIPYIKVKNSFPATYDMPNAVTVVYVAGYGASGTNVPKPIKQAMYLIIGHLYENREQVIEGSVLNELPFGVQTLLSPYVLEHSVVY